MRHLRWLLIAGAALVLLPPGASGQNVGTITGTITSQDNNQPLTGVQVFVAGTSRGTISNQQGRYVLPGVPAGTQIVRAVIIGYAQGEDTVTVTAGQSVTADFSLRSSAVELEGVIVNAVTGQAERKRQLGTNTSTIQSAEIDKAPITKMADVLTGRATGVTLQNVNGATGTSQRILIRGANSISLSNEPLIFLDGVLISNSKAGFGVGGQDYSRLNDINPEDIANIEVLKGPAASAIYGTAAANGVLLITTKRGHTGQTVWKGYAEVGNLKDVNDYPTVWLTYQVNDASAPTFNDRGRLNTDGDAYVPCPNLDAAYGDCTQDQTASLDAIRTAPYDPFRTGSRQQYGLSAAGGGDRVTYYVSSDWEQENGVYPNNTLNKVSLRANMNASLLDNLDVQLTTGYTKSNLQLNANDNNIFSPIINAILATPYVPTQAQINASGPGGRPGTGFGYFLSDIEEITTIQEIDRYIMGGNTTWRPLSWLSANVNLGLDYYGRFDHETLQPERLPIAATYTPGYRDAQRGSSYDYTANASTAATFNPTDNLISNTTIGGSYTKELFQAAECYGVGIVEGTNSCGATSSLFFVDEDFSEIITIGGFAQEQLAWKDRVFLAGSLRTDNNSAFGKNFGFIWYPSGSLSWVVSEEPFFPKINFLSNLRVRTAIGTSGLRPGFRDAITLLEPTAVTIGGEDVSAVTLNSTGNLDLKPERTTEYELGFDAGLFQDRVSLDFTYFHKRSKDALISRRLPPSYGLTTSIFDNLGSIANWGTEIGLNAQVLQLPNAALNMRLSATTLDNKVEQLGEGVEPITLNRGNQRHQEGFPTGAYFSRPYSFNDADGNGKLTIEEVELTSDTAVYMGHSIPTNTQSLSADLTLFKYLTLTTLFERRAGFKQLNFTEAFRCSTGYARATRGNCPGVADPNASLADQAAFIAYRFYGQTTGYIEDADFIKWREMSVTLAVPPALSSHISQLQGASITFSGRNLKTWTDYTGVDPEINETGGDTDFIQGEFNTQPPVRYFTVRLNLTF